MTGDMKALQSRRLGDSCIEIWDLGSPAVHAGKLHGRGAFTPSLRYAARQLLALKIGVPADSLRFSIGDLGKLHCDHGLFFSLSENAAQAVIAIAMDGDIGIDLQVDAVEHADLEVLGAADLPPGTDSRSVWARLEAVLKCLGWGFRRQIPAFFWQHLVAPAGFMCLEDRRVWWQDQPHPHGSLCVAAAFRIRTVRRRHLPPEAV
jgi:hypothetical protein